MKNKIGIICSFLVIVLAGCGKHQQVAQKGPEMMTPNTQQAGTSEAYAVNTDTVSDVSSGTEDSEGYQIRPVDLKIKEGRPYLPVGAEFITQDGKVDLGDVIKAIADHKGFSVSWADDVDQQKPVDCNIKAADNFYDALDNILRQLDYYYEIKEDTIVIGYKETKKYHMTMPNFSEEMSTSLGGDMLPKGEGETGLKATAKLDMKSEAFNFWDDLTTTLTSIVNCEGCPAPLIDKSLGTITITASKRVHKAVAAHLAAIEKEAYKQVIIEAKIIEVTLNEDSAKGIDWERVFGGPDFTGKTLGGVVDLGDPVTGLLWSKDSGWDRFLNSVSISNVTWAVVYSAFEQFGDTRIIANPKVHILNGHGAVLSAGQVLSYLEKCNVTVSSETGVTTLEAQTGSITEGLSVGIKANIKDDNEVVIYVFPALTRLIQFRDIFNSDCGTLQAPEMSVREMSTYAKVRNGEILVIGGLIQQNNDTTNKNVPFLADLPFLGKLFGYERINNTKSELVILLKPKIVTMQ